MFEALCVISLNTHPDIEVEKVSEEESTRRKKYSVLPLYLLAIVEGIVVSIPETSVGNFFYDYSLFFAGSTISTFMWCYTDMQTKGKFVTEWIIGLVLFGPLALPVYFIWVKGVRNGSILTGKALVVLMVALLLTLVSSLITLAVI